LLRFVKSFTGWFGSAGSNRPAFMAIDSVATYAIVTGSCGKNHSDLARNLQPESDGPSVLPWFE
jgi:hypothetical protein